MRRVLMVSFQFPPMAGSSGVQRALRFAQQLPALGWSPSILTAHPRVHPHTGGDLVDEIPGGLTVRRAFALDAARHLAIAGRYPGFLARPDRWHSWLFGAVPAGLKLIRDTRPDAIWSTYPIPTAHLIGYWLSKLSGLPWVADFRDPMAHDGYPADPVLWRRFAAIERRVFAQASRFTFTTPGAARLYAQRFPTAADRIRVIENGYSEAAFQQAERAERIEHIEGIKDDAVLADRSAGRPDAIAAARTAATSAGRGPRVLLHSGVVYPDWRSPARLFEALAALKSQGRVDASTLRLRLRATAHDGFVRGLAEHHGIADLVELAPPVPYAEALAEMLRADGLLLLQSNDCNDQIPAKAYEYLRARRPVLTLADPAGDTAQLMRRAGLPHGAALEDGAGVATALDRFLDDLFHDRAALPAPAAIAAASRESRTGELARVLDEACAPHMPTAEAHP